MEKILKNSTLQKLKKVLAQEKEVLAAYVFGSRAAKTAMAKSDLDMAVLVVDRKRVSERMILKKIIASKIKLPFEIDLSCVDLGSPPLFLFQIIKNGVCIYEKDTLQRVSLEAKILHLYYDSQHLRDIYHRYLQKSLKEGTYGY